MKTLFILIFPLTIACVSNSDNDDSISNNNDLIVAPDNIEGVCPFNHTDSIIPIIYGYPTEATFAKADSGLVALGGCELGDEYYWCKIHEISF